jgi:phosphoribosylformylglycinamidine (FGAM) synthase-like enzyme
VLGGGAPVYHREYREPAYYQEYQKFDINSVPDIKDTEECYRSSKYPAAHPNIASKRWVYEQYDSMVGIANRSTNAAF